MAIILNDAYALLSDPQTRFMYDKEQAKVAELRGYTGKPIYSVWFGPEDEQRAVFVDEVKCIGCLKCALFAEKTFAIESIYGRARVVVQWADPEHKIQEAIETCPVDCISIVERSNLAALEFLMSKQPRGNVRMSTGNAVGTCVSNIFVDVKKFQTKFHNSMDKASTQRSKEADLQREARMAAIQAIRSISNWLYWQSPTGSGFGHNLTKSAQKSTGPNIEKLRHAAAALKEARESSIASRRQDPSNNVFNNQYWKPSTRFLPKVTEENGKEQNSSSKSLHSTTLEQESSEEEKFLGYRKKGKKSQMRWGIPIGTATVGAFVVGLQAGEGAAGGLKDHIGGSLALEIVNSSWLQVTLAGVTWYLIGTAAVGLVELLKTKERFHLKE